MKSFNQFVKSRNSKFLESFSAMMPNSAADSTNSVTPSNSQNEESFPAPDPKAVRKWAMIVESLNEIASHLGRALNLYTGMFDEKIIPYLHSSDPHHGNDFNVFTDFVGDYLDCWHNGKMTRKPYSDDPNRIEFFHKANEIANSIDPNQHRQAVKDLLKNLEEHPEQYSRGGMNGPSMRNSLRKLNSLV
jgi:hypothetical protein